MSLLSNIFYLIAIRRWNTNVVILREIIDLDLFWLLLLLLLLLLLHYEHIIKLVLVYHLVIDIIIHVWSGQNWEKYLVLVHYVCDLLRLVVLYLLVRIANQLWNLLEVAIWIYKLILLNILLVIHSELRYIHLILEVVIHKLFR